MTMRACRKCFEPYDSTASKCPKCGEVSASNTRVYILILVLLAGFLLITYMPRNYIHYPVSEAEAAAAEAQAERQKSIKNQFSAWSGSHKELEKYIKSSMHDPSSYEHQHTSYIENGDKLTITTSFRGRNSYGAIVLETVVASVDLNGFIISVSTP